jgi:hypothetical protein
VRRSTCSTHGSAGPRSAAVRPCVVQHTAVPSASIYHAHHTQSAALRLHWPLPWAAPMTLPYARCGRRPWACVGRRPEVSQAEGRRAQTAMWTQLLSTETAGGCKLGECLVMCCSLPVLLSASFVSVVVGFATRQPPPPPPPPPHLYHVGRCHRLGCCGVEYFCMLCSFGRTAHHVLRDDNGCWWEAGGAVPHSGAWTCSGGVVQMACRGLLAPAPCRGVRLLQHSSGACPTAARDLACWKLHQSQLPCFAS